jgi:ribosome-binding protein aMBF1 (putative translation factor)
MLCDFCEKKAEVVYTDYQGAELNVCEDHNARRDEMNENNFE